MDIKTQFILQAKLSAYQTPKFYEDISGKKPKTKIPRNVSKKITIFQQISKAASKTPGPARYITNPEVKAKENRLSIKNQQLSPNKFKQTYLDSILKRSSSMPSVGKYNIGKGGKQYQVRKSNDKFESFRPTVFGSINKDMIDTAPGMYSVRQTLLQKSPKYSISPEPKKQVSLPKIPSPCDYNPLPSSYSTFEKRSLSSIDQQLQVSTFGGRIKQKLKEKSPGPVYNLITDWAGKKKNQQGNQFNVYKSVSNGPKESVYRTMMTQR